jgi:hypothetical protein
MEKVLDHFKKWKSVNRVALWVGLSLVLSVMALM